MKCPKCGGEIAMFDLRPNCKHCGVNIMYYTQEADLARDAKRTELEGAVARMVIARIKANFIGGKLQIARMVFVLIAAAALLVPFSGVRFNLPFYDDTLSFGLIGLIGAFKNGLLLKLPSLLSGALVSKQVLAAVIPAAFMLVIVILDLICAGAFLLGFLNLTKSTRVMRNTALVGAAVSVLSQIAAVVMKLITNDTLQASVILGFGALVSLAMFVVLFILNRALLQKGIEPAYKENDLKRKELLKRVRSGEVDLDSLSLPIFESEEEHEERMKALEEALKAEEEGKEL